MLNYFGEVVGSLLAKISCDTSESSGSFKLVKLLRKLDDK